MNASRVSDPSWSNHALTCCAPSSSAAPDHCKVAALEGAGRHHVLDRHVKRLVGPDRGKLFAPTPPVRHRRDDPALGSHHAGVARMNIHRQLGRGRGHVDRDPERLVGRNKFGMSGLGSLDIAGRCALVRARTPTGGQRPQMGGAPQKHVGQPVRLVAEAPATQHCRAPRARFQRRRLKGSGRVGAVLQELHWMCQAPGMEPGIHQSCPRGVVTYSGQRKWIGGG